MQKNFISKNMSKESLKSPYFNKVKVEPYKSPEFYDVQKPKSIQDYGLFQEPVDLDVDASK